MGEGLFLLVLLAAFFFLVVPVLAIVAAVRASSLHTRLTTAEQKIAALQAGRPASAEAHEPFIAPLDDPTPEPGPEPEPEPEVEPVSIPHPEAQPKPEPEPDLKPALAAAPPAAEATVKPPRIDWERRIAANWMVWAGAVALALGGLFLVRVAIDAGWFGPTARTLLAGLLGVGLIAGSYRARALKVVQEAQTAVRHLPSILAGAGVITLFGATLAAGVLYALLPPPVIFVLFAVIAALAVALAWMYGPALAALGLVGAYVGPFFTGADGGSPLMLLPYAFAVTAGALGMIRVRGWPFVSMLALVGAMLWGLLGFFDPSVHSQWAVPVYALALAALAALFGQHQAHDPLLWLKSEEGEARTPVFRIHGEAFAVAHLFWLGASALILLHTMDYGLDPVAVPALSLFGGMGLFATWRRAGYSLFVMISAATSLGAMALWTPWVGQVPSFAATLALLFAGAGWLLLPRLQVQAPVAIVSALFAPAAFMIAAWRMTAFDPPALWAMAAFGLAALNVMALERLSARDEAFKSHPATGAVYALAAAIFMVLCVAFAFSGLWLGTGIAVVTLALAALYRRFDLWLLRRASVLAGAAAVVVLLRPDLLTEATISTRPVLNALSFSILPSIAALLGAGWLLKARQDTARALSGMAAFLGFALVGLLIRHSAGGGSLQGPQGGLSEFAGYAISYLGAAAGLFWRNASGPVLNLLRWGGLVVGSFAVLLGLGALNNAAVPGWVVLNLLLPAFAMPALLLAVCAVGQRRADLPGWSRALSIAAMGLGLIWALLETHRAFTGPVLFGAEPISDAQMWSYSATLVVYALGLLVLGTLRHSGLARFGSLAVLATALVKVFIFDLGALDGVLRAASFIGLGATLLGTALFYQRFVFNRGDRVEVSEGS